MPRQLENRFRDSIHRHLDRKTIHQEKTNNPFRSGMFDDWYSANPYDLWVEYKFQAKLGSVKANLSPLQFYWGSERYKEGRNVAVIVGMPQGAIILKRSEWQERIPVLEVEQRLLKRKQVAIAIAYFTSTYRGNLRKRVELWETTNELAP